MEAERRRGRGRTVLMLRLTGVQSHDTRAFTTRGQRAHKAGGEDTIHRQVSRLWRQGRRSQGMGNVTGRHGHSCTDVA